MERRRVFDEYHKQGVKIPEGRYDTIEIHQKHRHQGYKTHGSPRICRSPPHERSQKTQEGYFGRIVRAVIVDYAVVV